MTIATLNEYIASAKQPLIINKTASRTSVALGWFSTFELAGSPGAGVLAGTSTANGVVPTDATAGCPDITNFGAGNVGYLSKIDFANTVASRLRVSDMVFKAGAYAFGTATTTLSAQPSYSSRMPGGSFSNAQIWLEVSTAFATGTAWQVQVTYTNQSGTTGRTTTILPATAAAGLTVGRMYQLPLQAGDSGVQTIESVIVTNGGTAMTAGAFNILVLRPLWTGRVMVANAGGTHGLAETALPIVFQDSALVLHVNADSTATGLPELQLVIANG